MNKIEVIYSNDLTLKNLTEEEIGHIKKELTFDNPTYIKVKKYSRYQYTNVPPYLFYYEGKGNDLHVPIGYDYSFISPDRIDHVQDERISPPATYPMFKLELREAQSLASTSFIRHNVLSSGNNIKGIIQLPTGQGKSILALSLAYTLGLKTLIIVHKDDLVKGWQDEIKLSFDGHVKPGLIKAQKFEIGGQITIATVQTLNRLSPEVLDSLYSTFGLVVTDEVHHCPSRTFSIGSNFKSRYKIGLTATPERKDGLSHVMQLYFGDFCYMDTPKSHSEDILPVEVFLRNMDVYFNPICAIEGNKCKLVDMFADKDYVKSRGEYRLSELLYGERPKIPYHPIDDHTIRDSMEFYALDIEREYRKGHSCLVFFTQKEHCKILHQILKFYNAPFA